MLTAVFQTNIKFEDKNENLTKASVLIEKAASCGAKLALFPEMSFTGFSMNIFLTGEADSYTVEYIKQEAIKNNIAIGFGYVKLNKNKGENHYAVIDSHGNLLSDYIKIHSFTIGGEREDFISGNALPSQFDIESHKISTFICYDLRFPEIFRAVTDRSTIMIVAANWPEARREHWMTLLKARAIEDQTYIIGINCVGIQDGISYSGDSMIIDPLGNVISRAEPRREQMLLCDIPDDVDKFRSDFPALSSRKFDLYRNFT